MRKNIFSLLAAICLALPAQAQMQVLDYQTLFAIKNLGDVQKWIAPIATEILKKDMNLGPYSNLNVVKEEVSEQPDADYVEVVLHNENIHTIRLTLKGPRGFYKDRRQSSKVLFVTSGFFAGRGTVKVMDKIENMVVVGYEYPHTADELKKKPALIWDAVRLTSAQMAASMQWLSEQGFVDRYSMYSVGVSLGGIFLPSAMRIAQQLNVPIRGAVFAYTGSDFGALAVDSLKDSMGADGLRVVKEVAEIVTLVHNPEIHLPFLHGKFLMIHGDADTVFPASSTQKFESSITRQPKETVVIKGGHINLDKPELIEQTQEAIKKWLAM